MRKSLGPFVPKGFAVSQKKSCGIKESLEFLHQLTAYTLKGSTRFCVG
jgi:hypothetical protein